MTVRLIGAIVPLAVSFLWCGCGYVGDPQAPALMIPGPVEDLQALQRGNRIIMQFTTPPLTTEGIVIEEFKQVDLRVGAEGVQPFDRAAWEANASPMSVPTPWEPGSFRVEVSAQPWVGREVIAGVRQSARSGRWSSWSNLVALHVVEPVTPPEDLRAMNDPMGVRLRWTPSQARAGVRFRILRRTGEQESYQPAGETEALEWVDAQTRYGVSYEYIVQGLLRAGDDLAESEPTPPVAVTPTDRFPPPAPQGLRAIAGLNTIELAWERVPAEDLAGYRVYRESPESGQRVADGVTVPAYSDPDVRSGVHYRYRVTAVDELGNESEPSEPADRTAP